MEQDQQPVMSTGLQTREMSEVQGQVMMAKKFPRNIISALDSIKTACSRKRLAENAIYSYPRGGTQVEGPSIRLAETIAKYWGNIDFGIVELENKGNESLMMAYAWDLETNTRSRQVFTVKHERYSKAQGNVKLTDQRDIYEIAANMASRRLRARILSIIPGDVVDEALEVCNKTLAGQSDKPLVDRIKIMIDAFKGVGVTQKQIEMRLQKDSPAITEQELVSLRKIYKSLQDGMSSVNDWFEYEKPSIKKPEGGKAEKGSLKLYEELKTILEDAAFKEGIKAAVSDKAIVVKKADEYSAEEVIKTIDAIKKYQGFIDSEKAGSKK